MGAGFAKYEDFYSRETQNAGARGGAAGGEGYQPPVKPPPAPTYDPPPAVRAPTIAPNPNLRLASPEQADIQDSFSTTNQYAQRYGIPQQHF